MAEEYSIPLSKIIHELGLSEYYLPKAAEEIFIRNRDINRPGVEFTGFFDLYDPSRISILGLGELTLLNNYPAEKSAEIIEQFFSLKPSTIIFARDLEPSAAMLEAAQKYGVPLVISADTTSNLMADLIAYLNVELAPRITRHGVLVEVYGEGVLLTGDSGVGKSETAIELVKRGHRLIADDAVEIRRTSRRTLVGQPPENIRHFIELRGIGIVNVRRIFGMGSVKTSERIDMCINLEQWDSTKVYDRMGIDSEYTDILGIRVPVITVPVKPGRNLAIIIEVAAMNNRQKKMGYNAAQELLVALGMDPEELKGQEIERDLDNSVSPDDLDFDMGM